MDELKKIREYVVCYKMSFLSIFILFATMNILFGFISIYIPIILDTIIFLILSLFGIGYFVTEETKKYNEKFGKKNDIDPIMDKYNNKYKRF